MTKEEQVVNMIKEGTHTREEILKEVGVKPTVMASYLSGMRSAAKFTGAEIYPVEVLDKESNKRLFKVMTMDDAQAYIEAHRKTTSSTGKARTPLDKLRLARKRLRRAVAALGRWENVLEGDNVSEESRLRHGVALAEHALADFLHSQVEETLEAIGEDVGELNAALDDEEAKALEQPEESDEELDEESDEEPVNEADEPVEAESEEENPWD